MKCAHCKHTKDQHDEDGFCEVEDVDRGICDCPGYEDKKTDEEIDY